MTSSTCASAFVLSPRPAPQLAALLAILADVACCCCCCSVASAFVVRTRSCRGTVEAALTRAALPNPPRSMQNPPLLLSTLLDRGTKMQPDNEIVT